MKDIHAASGRIADIVAESVVETFTGMFGQDVSAASRKPPTAPDNVVISCCKLLQGSVEVDFVFKFDMELLLMAAAGIFTPEYIKNNPVHEDLACEIANIVCAKVKSCLNDEGYDTEMGFPFVPKADEAKRLMQEQVVHMHFFYRDRDKKQGVGVAVNFTVV
jgi:CheY-specific phosphatase CheX